MKSSLHSILILLLLVTQSFQVQFDGYFDILSYNVGGLPEPISSTKPSKYTKLISPKLNAYDVINAKKILLTMMI